MANMLMSHGRSGINRRSFLTLGLAATAGILTSSCALTGGTTPARQATASPTTRAAGQAAQPGLTPTPDGFVDVPPGTILGNEDTPGFYVRFITNFAALDPGRWTLEIKGLVDAPATLTLRDIERELPFVEQSSRLKCVECWSKRATWGGFRYAALAGLVKPRAEAAYVRFTCEDGYFEALPISELQHERALFTTRMDGRPLPAAHGAPLRMILPWLYGYKGAKTINVLEFTAEPGEGYWPTFGAYSPIGAIQPGIDTPIDLTFRARPIAGGEITDY